MKVQRFPLKRPLAGICALVAAGIVSFPGLRAETIPLQQSMNQMDIQYSGPSHAARTAGRGSPPWFGVDMKVTNGSSIMIRLWTPPAGDPAEKRGTDSAMELRILPVNRGATPPVHDNTFKQSTVIGVVEPAARAVGSLRDLTFPIPRAMAATGRVTVICNPRPERTMGIVTELRILTE